MREHQAVAAGQGVRDVKSAARTIEVLEYLAHRQSNPARLQEVADALGIPRSSTYALLRTLITCGWVSYDETGTGYRLGLRLLVAGASYIDADPYVRIARPILADVAGSLNETIHLARLDEDDVVYLLTQESRQEVRAFHRAGRRLPAWATSLGKSLLAERDPSVLPARLSALTPHTITDRDELLEDLERTRHRGYAVDHEENTIGLRCYGVALRYTDPPLDALSVSIPTSRLTPQLETRVLQSLEAARVRIEQSAPLIGR